jgi:hypothetical protein
MEGTALTALAGLSAYSSWSGGRIADLKTRSLILVSYRKFQNDFRAMRRGKTGYIDDVVTDARTQISDKRPLLGMKGSTKGVPETLFGRRMTNVRVWGNLLYRLPSGRFKPFRGTR